MQLYPTLWVAMDYSMPDFPALTISWSLLKLIIIESMMASSHLILPRPLLLPPSIFPSIRVFPVSQLFASGGLSIGASAGSQREELRPWQRS